VRQPVNQMVEATVEILLAQINDRKTPTKHIEIDGPLMVRSTTKGPTP